MDVAVNIPTSVGASEASNFPFADRIRWADQRSFGTTIEQLGFDGLGVPDHLMTGDGPTMECLTVLAGLATATDEVYLYPKTVNNELRHAPLVAKTCATLDQVSGGRLKLGMGAGWKADEAVAYGYDWPDAPTRLRRMEEAVTVLKRLWTEPRVDYDGDYYTLEGAVCTPHPVQDPHPPIMIGGPGEEFTLRIAAQHADSWNCWGSHEFYDHKLSVLADHCATYGTDYDDIEKSWFGRCVLRETEAAVESLLEAVPRFRPEHQDDGMTHLVGTPATVAADIERFRTLGVDEFVVEFIDFPRPTGAELFVDAVLPAL
jgi:alkanesulfonate monooxygenase SsuD/methylene tetrahydromethanopterin reductase-like flavin-dependent oxidoreductase (luciferase family)